LFAANITGWFTAQENHCLFNWKDKATRKEIFQTLDFVSKNNLANMPSGSKRGCQNFGKNEVKLVEEG